MRSVLTGIDVLRNAEFASLAAQRVGLITNHTGRTRDGLSTADCLLQAPSVDLRALFGPEHGIRGEQDEDVADGQDAKTGLPVYSLYGARKKPCPEQLDGLDTLVFDIQDIGCRFYTYLSTLVNVMEAADEHQLRIVVLDRPNPINGKAATGPLPDADLLSFTASHPIPICHGMTLGELARLIHAERGFSCGLEVVPCDGWKRAHWLDYTGLIWRDPSPNMRSLPAAILYPGAGLLEFTNISVGRGTDTPFEVIGAPYIEPAGFAEALNQAGLPGLRFYPVGFTPRASVYSSEACGGVRLLITDREVVDSPRLGITLAHVLLQQTQGLWQPQKLMTLLANRSVFDAVVSGSAPSPICDLWAEDLRRFQQRREPFLLYA